MGPIWGRQDPGGPHVGPIDIVYPLRVYGYTTFRRDEVISSLGPHIITKSSFIKRDYDLIL